MIQFSENAIFETECFLSREAILTIDGEQHEVQYMVIIRMEGVDASTPKITEVVVEGIPDLDDYTFAPNLTAEERERRENKRDHIYKEAGEILAEYYKVEEISM